MTAAARRRVFLTGASGNIGFAVARELSARGIQTAMLVRKAFPALPGCRPVFGCLSNLRQLSAEIMDADVIHCASPRSVDRRTAIRIDIEGMADLLDLWQRGVLIYTSSQTVYGIPQGVLDEGSPLRASNWYDLAKITNEHQVSMSAHGAGRVGISLRVPLVFGSGPRRLDRQFLPALFDAVDQGRSFLFGSEEALSKCGSVYISEGDLARAVVAALDIDRSGRFNFAGGFCLWKDLIEAIGTELRREVKFVFREGAKSRPGELRMPQSRSEFDVSRFAAATGFAPRETMPQLVRAFARLYRAGGAAGAG